MTYKLNSTFSVVTWNDGCARRLSGIERFFVKYFGLKLNRDPYDITDFAIDLAILGVVIVALAP